MAAWIIRTKTSTDTTTRLLDHPLTIAAEATAQYTLKAADGDAAADDSLRLRERGDDLLIEVNGEVLLTIHGFFDADTGATFIVEGVEGESVNHTVHSTEAGSGAAQGVLWQYEPGVNAPQPGLGLSETVGTAVSLGFLVNIVDRARDDADPLPGPQLSPPALPDPADPSTITIHPFAGQMISTARVTVYDQNGNILVQGLFDFGANNGAFTFENTAGYSGPILVVIEDQNGDLPDYIDTVSGGEVNLDGSLSAMTLITAGQNADISVTQLTDLAVREAGVPVPSSLTEGQLLLTKQLLGFNSLVATLFGLEDITGPAVTLLSDTFDETDGLSAAELYGMVLGTLSSMGNLSSVLDLFSSLLEFGQTNTVHADLVAAYMNGREQLSDTDLVQGSLPLLSAPVLVDSNGIPLSGLQDVAIGRDDIFLRLYRAKPGDVVEVSWSGGLAGSARIVVPDFSGDFVDIPLPVEWQAETVGTLQIAIVIDGVALSTETRFDYDVLPVALSLQLAGDSVTFEGKLYSATGTIALADASLVEEDARLEYSIDNGVSWQTTFTPTEGLNHVQVRQVDQQDRPGPASPLFSFILDTFAEEPLILLVSGRVVVGTPSAIDAEFSLENMEPGAVLEYRINDGAWISFTDVSELNAAFDGVADGRYTLTVRQTDIVGNTSTGELEFKIDSDIQQLPIIDPDLVKDTGDEGYSDNGADRYTNNPQLKLLEDVYLHEGADIFWSLNEGDWTLGLDSFVPVLGENRVRLMQSTEYGESVASNEFVFFYDNTIATLTIALTASPLHGNTYDDALLSITGKEDDPLGVNPTVLEYRINGGAWTREYKPVTGSNVLQVRQIDRAGNVSEPSNTLTFDFQPNPPGEQVIIFNLTDADTIGNLKPGQTSSYFGDRNFKDGVEYWIYLVVEADRRTLIDQATLEHWKSAQNLDADDHIVLISSDGSPVLGSKQNPVTDFHFSSNTAEWLTANSAAATLHVDGDFKRYFDDAFAILDLWTGTAAWTNNLNSNYANYNWITLSAPSPDKEVKGNATDDKNFVLNEPDNPLGKEWDVEFTLTPLVDDSWETDFSQLNFDRDSSETTFYIRQRHQDGYVSDAIRYTVEVVDEFIEEPVVVMIDLSTGFSSSTDESGSRTFDIEKQYIIYIKVPAAGDLTLTEDQQWKDADQLDNNDQIILISDVANQVVGKAGEPIEYADYKYGGTPYLQWGLLTDQGALNTAARLYPNGQFQRHREGANTPQTVDLFSGWPATTALSSIYGASGIDFNTHWVDTHLVLLGEEVSNLNQLAGRDTFLPTLREPLSEWKIEYSVSGGNANDWTEDASSILQSLNSMQTSDPFTNTTPHQVYVRLKSPGNNYTEDRVLNFELHETVNFDLTSGKSSVGFDGKREFHQDHTYRIYIKVAPDSKDVTMDALHKWSGADKLGNDDTIILISSDTVPTTVPINGYKDKLITTVTWDLTGGMWRWRTNHITRTQSRAAELEADGNLKRFYNSQQTVADIFEDTATNISSVNFLYSKYTHYRATDQGLA